MSLYIRLKRNKVCVFLHADPVDKGGDILRKLEQLLGSSYGGSRLMFHSDEGCKVFPEDKSIADMAIQNDQIIYVCLRLGDGEYEEPHVDVPGSEIPAGAEDSQAADS
eukprot:ANDGO_04154.mRNA.1 ubiquitin family protein